MLRRVGESPEGGDCLFCPLTGLEDTNGCVCFQAGAIRMLCHMTRSPSNMTFFKCSVPLSVDKLPLISLGSVNVSVGLAAVCGSDKRAHACVFDEGSFLGLYLLCKGSINRFAYIFMFS